MKKIGEKLSAFFITVYLIFIITMLGIGLFLYSPIEYIKYKKSRYYKDTKEKYKICCTMSIDFKVYNSVKVANLPIEYIRKKTDDTIEGGFFLYEKSILITDAYPYYDEEKEMWLIIEGSVEEGDCTLEEYIKIKLDEISECIGKVICDNGFFLVDREIYDDEEIEMIKEDSRIILYDKNKMCESIKEFFNIR